MEEIGIFEAKTRFPGLCDQVVRSGTPVMVRRRGKPLVVVSPANMPIDDGEGILERWKAWESAHGESDESDFPEVWKKRHDKTRSPLEE